MQQTNNSSECNRNQAGKVYTLVDVASFFEPFADSSRLLSTLTARQVHQTYSTYLLTRHLLPTHTHTDTPVYCQLSKHFSTLWRCTLVGLWNVIHTIPYLSYHANLLALYEKTKPNTSKAHIHQSKEIYYMNHELDGGPDPPMRRGNFGKNGRTL